MTVRARVLALAVLLVAPLAACGSNLDPSEVRAAGGTAYVAATIGPDGVPTAPVVPGVDPNAPVVPGVDPVAPGASVPTDPSGRTTAPAPGDPTQDPTDDPTGEPPGGDPDAVDCTGFKNQTGITDTTITIGNSSDITGPVPGLFAEAQQATAAYVKYFNDSGSTICGRKLALAQYDSRTDAGADQQSYAAGCEETFAMVGSMSGFDSGGAATAQDCGLPDIRAISVTKQRTACTTCYAAQPAGPNEFENAVPDFIKRNFDGGQHAAMLYLNGGAASENGPSQVRFSEKRGMKFVYVQGIDLAEFNYTPYVQAMRDKGVETVQFVGANPQFVRLAQTMQQQGFKPKLLLLDPTAYSDQYTGPAGDAAIGTTVFVNFTPFEEASKNPEVNLYLNYLQQTNPSAKPGFFGLFAWSSARLFVEQATALGGDLTRQSLVDSMKKVDGWDANGLHAPMRVGAKRIAECWRFIQWDGSRWNALEGTKYQCSGVTTD